VPKLALSHCPLALLAVTVGACEFPKLNAGANSPEPTAASRAGGGGSSSGGSSSGPWPNGSSSNSSGVPSGFFRGLPTEAHTTEDALSALEVVAIEPNGARRNDTTRGPAQVYRFTNDRFFFMARTLRHTTSGLRRGDLFVYLDQRAPLRSFVRYLERSRAGGVTTAYTGAGHFRLQNGGADRLRLALAVSLQRADGLRSTRLEVRGLIVGRHGVPTSLPTFGASVWGHFPEPFNPMLSLVDPGLDAFDEAAGTEEGLWIHAPPLGFEDDPYDWEDAAVDSGAGETGGLIVDPSAPPPTPIPVGEPAPGEPGTGGAESGPGPSGSDAGDDALLGDDEDDDGVPADANSYEDWSFSSPAPSSGSSSGSGSSGSSSSSSSSSSSDSSSSDSSSSDSSGSDSSSSDDSSDSGSDSSADSSSDSGGDSGSDD